MAREYPKFIYQNVTGTKGDGEYIVHLLEPRVVFKVLHEANGKVNLRLLDDPSESIEPIMKRALDWYIARHLPKK